MMRRFYNGYRFSYNADQAVYNPTLALYFLKHWHNYCQYPRDMLDSNLAMDRNKINYIAKLPRGEQVIAAALDEENPLLVNRLSHRFGVAEMLQKEKETVSMASLLYFFGVLTIGGETPLRQLILHIPNLVTQKLYVEELPAWLIVKSNQRGRKTATIGQSDSLSEQWERRPVRHLRRDRPVRPKHNPQRPHQRSRLPHQRHRPPMTLNPHPPPSKPPSPAFFLAL